MRWIGPSSDYWRNNPTLKVALVLLLTLTGCTRVLWNFSAVQTPLDQPWETKLRRGAPISYGHYEVVPCEGVKMPRPWAQGVVLDYTHAGNGFFETFRLAKDPLVAVNEGDMSLLLGTSWIELGFLQLVLPIPFALKRVDLLDINEVDSYLAQLKSRAAHWRDKDG